MTPEKRAAAELRLDEKRSYLQIVDGATEAALTAGDVGKAQALSAQATALNAEIQDLIDRLAAPPPQSEHPLAQFVRLSHKTKAVRWVVPGLIENGVVTIAGARGKGKTTAILPLALSVAGLHAPGYPLAPHPDRWRHVIYIVEQVSQAERILAGVVEHSDMGITWEQVEDRLHLVESRRLDPHVVADAGDIYKKQFTRVVDGVEILPLVVFDTQASIFEMQDERDNSEASRIMALLKQRFAGLPAWIVGHVAKASIERNDIATITARGAGAFEADSIANFYLTSEGTGDTETRFFSVGKTRAEPRFGKDLVIHSDCATTEGENEWGEMEPVHLRWATMQPMTESRAALRAKAQEEAQEAAGQAREAELRQDLLDRAEEAQRLGNPLSKTGLKAAVRGKGADIQRAIDALEAEGWLHQVEVPGAIRAHNSRARFLVRLTPEERDHHRTTGALPTEKTAIPPSWRKAEIPPVPANFEGATKTGAKSGKNHS